MDASKILKTGFGWISNSGDLHACERYGHFEGLSKIVEDPKFSQKIEEYDDRLNSIQEDSEALIAQGEHPEWHVYEMAQDSYGSEIVDMAYKFGWIRIGVDRQSNILGVEARPKAIKKHYQLLKDLEEVSGLKLEIYNR